MIYKVTRKSSYREHPSGSFFPAVLMPDEEARALARGDIEVIDRSPIRVSLERAKPPRGWPLKT